MGAIALIVEIGRPSLPINFDEHFAQLSALSDADNCFELCRPIFLFGGVLVSLSLIGHIPGIEKVAQVIAEQILQFLATFGRRNPFQGLVVIALTCSLVGALFDTYAFYRYQSLRNH